MLDLGDELESVHLGHHQVQHDKIGLVLFHVLEHPGGVGRVVDLVTFFGKDHFHHL